MDFPELMGLASGHVEARIVQTAVELRIFDAFEARPLSSRRPLAQALQLDAQATELLLNALTALGLLEKHGDQFSLTELSRRYLVRNSPHYVGGMIRLRRLAVARLGKACPKRFARVLPTRPPNMYQDDPRGNRNLHQRHGFTGQSARRRGSAG